MSWWRKNWRWILALSITGLGIIVVLLLYIGQKRREAAELRAQLALMRAGAKVEGLRADREARKIELMQNKEEAAKLDKEIADARREAVSIVKDVDGMSDVEVALDFKRLGY